MTTTNKPHTAATPDSETKKPRPIVTIVRRELLTRSTNRTIIGATLALAVIAGGAAAVGGWYLTKTQATGAAEALDPQILFATVMITALLASLVYSSQTLTSGVVEEKSSRIVEILMTKIGVRPLLMGKMLGVGLVTFAQLLVVGAALVAGFSLVDGWSTLNISLGSSFGWFLLWFFEGFVLYACLATLLASTVARQEDLSSALTPLSVLQMVLLVVALYVVPTQLDSEWVRSISFLPLVSSYVMPMRFALGDTTTSEIVIAVVVAAVTIPVLFRMTTIIYSNNALRTGTRISWRKAFKSDDVH